MNFKAVFFGTPNFVLPVLEALWSMRPEVELVSVVTAPDKVVGRKQELTPPPAKMWAQQHDIRTLQPEKLDGALLEALRALHPHVGVMAAFGKIVPKAVLEVFPNGILNIHPSLLPRWRGPSPVSAAIAAGDKKTGVTLMLTDEKIDHGPIIAQKHYALRGDESCGFLTATLFQCGAKLLNEKLIHYLRGEIIPLSQVHEQATHTKLLRRDDGKIDWRQPAEHIFRLARAYDQWPGIFTILLDGQRVKILRVSRVVGKQTPAPPGTLQIDAEGFPLVSSGNGWLRFDRVQQEGRTPTAGSAFLRGRPDLIGQRLA